MKDDKRFPDWSLFTTNVEGVHALVLPNSMNKQVNNKLDHPTAMHVLIISDADKRESIAGNAVFGYDENRQVGAGLWYLDVDGKYGGFALKEMITVPTTDDPSSALNPEMVSLRAAAAILKPYMPKD